MSPELLDPDQFKLGGGRPTKDSDCYALGMVILEVLSGKPPFPDYNGMIVMRKVVEGERPGRPQGGEGVWFTDDLWEMLEQCWSSQPGRRPTIDTVLRCLKHSSTAWQPLPPGPGGYVSDYQSDFTLSHDPSVDPSTFLHLVSNLTHPQMPFVVEWIGSPEHDRTLAPSQNQPHSAYVGQGSHQLSPGSQQRLAELPVSMISNMADTFVLYDNLRHIPGAPQ